MTSTKGYIYSWIGGSILNAFLLILICSLLGFNYKSAICVYIYGIPGFFVKGGIAFLPYVLISKNNILNKKLAKVAFAWIPLILFILWYWVIISFQVERFYTDLEFGYTSRLPHFIIQIFTTIIVCITMTILIIRNRFNLTIK